MNINSINTMLKITLNIPLSPYITDTTGEHLQISWLLHSEGWRLKEIEHRIQAAWNNWKRISRVLGDKKIRASERSVQDSYEASIAVLNRDMAIKKRTSWMLQK